MGIIDKVKEEFRGTKVGKAIATSAEITARLVFPPLNPALDIYHITQWYFNDSDYQKACSFLQKGQILQAKELLESMVEKDHCYDDKVCDKLLEIHDQLQENENVIFARNLAIYLIGSKDITIKNRAVEFYKSNTKRLIERGFTKTIVPWKRKYVYLGESIKSIGGLNLMDEDSNQTMFWFFDIDNIPQDLIFQQENPEPGLYVQHPCSPNRYYPRENVEKVWFDEKVNEFEKLMGCLGATRIQFVSKKESSETQDTTKEVKAETSVDAGEIGDYKAVGVGVDPSLKTNNKEESTRKTQQGRQRLFSPKEKIYVPDGLLWYDSDERWKEIVKLRIHRGILQDKFLITSEETNLISKEIDAKVKSRFKYFVSVKGNFYFNEQKVFTQSEEFSQSFYVEFAPLDENLVPMGASSQAAAIVKPTATVTATVTPQQQQTQQDLKALIPSDNSSQTILDKKRKNLVIWILGGVAVALAAGFIIALL